jgi:hypothetical protein
MPKLICINCQCELKPETNGVIVVEMASFGPYKVWSADLLKCPGCGVEIVSGFADQPIRADHYAKDFPDWFDELLSSGARIIYDYERPRNST